jgi:hypothetical protein
MMPTPPPVSTWSPAAATANTHPHESVQEFLTPTADTAALSVNADSPMTETVAVCAGVHARLHRTPARGDIETRHFLPRPSNTAPPNRNACALTMICRPALARKVRIEPTSVRQPLLEFRMYVLLL